MKTNDKNQTVSADELPQMDKEQMEDKETVIEVPEEESALDEIEEVDEISSVETEVEQLKNDLQQEKDKYLRLMAEFDNFRKRMMREKTELILNGGEGVIKLLLPVLDDIDRAEEMMDTIEEGKAVNEGVCLIFEKLRTILGQKGLKKVCPVGESFDVDYHEAVAMVPGQPKDLSGKVIDCIQAGYLLNDKVIRHAKVAVAE